MVHRIDRAQRDQSRHDRRRLVAGVWTEHIILRVCEFFHLQQQSPRNLARWRLRNGCRLLDLAWRLVASFGYALDWLLLDSLKPVAFIMSRSKGINISFAGRETCNLMFFIALASDLLSHSSISRTARPCRSSPPIGSLQPMQRLTFVNLSTLRFVS
jgi:hypothetical protein